MFLGILTITYDGAMPTKSQKQHYESMQNCVNQNKDEHYYVVVTPTKTTGISNNVYK